MFLVDESGSMGGEQTFLQTFVPTLDSALLAQGINTRQFGLIGYGSSSRDPRGYNLQGPGFADSFGTATEFAAAVPRLTVDGGTEDGYDAIGYAMQNYFGTAGTDRRILVLVSDEDRDNYDTQFDFANIQTSLQNGNVSLVGIVGQQQTDQAGTPAIGASKTETFLDTNNDGVPEKSTAPIFTTAAGSTKADYTDLILALPNGCVADLDQFRAGGTAATAFAKVLSDCLVNAIIVGPPPTGTTPSMAFSGTRDGLAAFANSMHDQLGLRLSGETRDRDRFSSAEPSEGTALAYAGERPVQIAADLPAIMSNKPSQTEFDFGPFKGFVSVRGQLSNFNYGGTAVNYRGSAGSAIAGLDYQFSNGALLGLSVGLQGVDYSARGRADKVSGTGYSVGIYGTTPLGQSNFYLDGSIAYTFADLRTRRQNALGNADAKLNAGTFSAVSEVGYRAKLNSFTAVPALEVGFTHICINRYTETGPGALAFPRQNINMFHVTPKLGVSTSIDAGTFNLIPSLELGARFNGTDAARSITSLGAGGLTFNIPKSDPFTGIVKAGLAFANKEQTATFKLGYSGSFSQHVQTHDFTAGVRLQF